MKPPRAWVQSRASPDCSLQGDPPSRPPPSHFLVRILFPVPAHGSRMAQAQVFKRPPNKSFQVTVLLIRIKTRVVYAPLPIIVLPLACFAELSTLSLLHASPRPSKPRRDHAIQQGSFPVHRQALDWPSSDAGVIANYDPHSRKQSRRCVLLKRLLSAAARYSPVGPHTIHGIPFHAS